MNFVLGYQSRPRHTFVASMLMVALTVACSPSSLVDVQSPNTVVDPAQVNTPAAAAQLRTGALIAMMTAIGQSQGHNVIDLSGFMTDELTETQGSTGKTDDGRNAFSTLTQTRVSDIVYDQLQAARVQAQQAGQALLLYASNSPSVPRAWQGEMFAQQGYTVLWFAELFCSGIPLSSVPLVGVSYSTAGLTTQELFERAIVLFDSAMVAGSDSARFVNLARVGKARALLGLGRMADADTVVQSVPTDFLYQVQSSQSGDQGSNAFPFETYFFNARVQDNEGGNGLVWSTDPRTGVTTDPSTSGDMLRPAKYNVTPDGTIDPTYAAWGVPFRLADGLEARLIQAETALAAGRPEWLTILNTLRATCIGTAVCAPVPGLTASSLPALSDPGTPDARLDLLMQERAMWLYLTGHREGDLRRMARIYHRDPSTLWPTGTIVSPAFPPVYSLPLSSNGTLYGSDMVNLPDAREQQNNPLYGGCYDTNP